MPKDLDALIDEELKEPTLESLFYGGRETIQDVDFEDVPPKFPGRREDLKCGECGAPMDLRESKKYQKAPFYGCQRFPECRGTHGARPDGSPLGIPANKATKRARMRAHAIFDEVWKKRLTKHRGGAYAWMRQVMNLSAEKAHIAMFNAEQCEELIELVYRDYPSLKNRYAHLLYTDPFAAGEDVEVIPAEECKYWEIDPQCEQVATQALVSSTTTKPVAYVCDACSKSHTELFDQPIEWVKLTLEQYRVFRDL